MDLSDTIAPTSDQLDAVDLLSGPRTFTIERVSKGNAEQPVNIHLREFPRPWRPGKSMRRVLVACWGPDASTYVGRRVTLYCDPEVRFGGQEVGGTRISHLSRLDKPRQVPLLVSRGKSAMFIVRPLAETPDTEVTREQQTTMDAKLGELGLGDRASKLTTVGLIVGRTLASSNELSKEEASTVIETLDRCIDSEDPKRALDAVLAAAETAEGGDA